jgi:hypothetical protein
MWTEQLSHQKSLYHEQYLSRKLTRYLCVDCFIVFLQEREKTRRDSRCVDRFVVFCRKREKKHEGEESLGRERIGRRDNHCVDRFVVFCRKREKKHDREESLAKERLGRPEKKY